MFVWPSNISCVATCQHIADDMSLSKITETLLSHTDSLLSHRGLCSQIPHQEAVGFTTETVLSSLCCYLSPFFILCFISVNSYSFKILS